MKVYIIAAKKSVFCHVVFANIIISVRERPNLPILEQSYILWGSPWPWRSTNECLVNYNKVSVVGSASQGQV